MYLQCKFLYWQCKHITSQHFMKIHLGKPKFQNWLQRHTRTRKQRGVAIVTVMAVVVLMSTLVLSFFAMSKNEQISARLNAFLLQNYAVRDVALNFAIGQFRQATTWRDPKNPRGYTVWTSQPGMIRTFKENGDPGRLFKLYSASTMVTDGETPESVLEQEDMPKVWKGQPDVWVDLNKPVYKPSPDPKDGTVGGARNGEMVYPIVNPSAYTATSNNLENPEGFSYDDGAIEGVNSRSKELAMPVRWIYMLLDGTMGSVAPDGTFSSPSGSTVSRTNPIIGRFAFWADDESCKVNVNTASEGVFWDTPRASSPEDVYYAECQPTRNEFQRFPGHPAQVSLSSVLFPNRRFYPKFQSFDMSKTDDRMKPLRPSEMAFLWDLSPRISYKGGTIDSVAGTGSMKRANLSSVKDQVDNSPTKNFDDRLYTTPEEILFRAYTQKQRPNASGDPIFERALWAEEAKDYGLPFDDPDEFVQKVRNAQFLLTTKSSAPEVNMFGHPRISLWPVNMAAPNMIFDPDKTTSEKVTPYDTVIALSSMLKRDKNNGGTAENNDNIYFLCRNDPGSRHNELQNTSDARKRTLAMFRYLKRATGEGVDGMTYARKFPGIKAEGTFLQKYTMVGEIAGGSAAEPRFSDRDSLLANMLDYIRTTNLSDPFMKPDDRYGVQNSGGKYYGGQNTAYCFCGWDKLNGGSAHRTTYENVNLPMPKGIGRVATVSEAVFVAQLIGKYNGSGVYEGIPNWNGVTMPAFGLPGTSADMAGARVYELAMIVEAFIPSQGAAGTVPRVSASLSWGSPTQLQGAGGIATMHAGVQARAPQALLNTPLTVQRIASSYIDEVGYGGAAGGGALDQYSRFGGYSGFRPFANTADTRSATTARGYSCITFQPFALKSVENTPGTGGGPPIPKWEIAFKNTPPGGGAPIANSMFRLHIYDAQQETPNVDQNVQTYFFKMDGAFRLDVAGLNSPGSEAIHTHLAQAFTKMGGTDAVIPNVGSRFAIQSFVIPHGDYRMSGANRTLGRGTPPLQPGAAPQFWNSLVPVIQNKSYLWEPGTGWSTQLNPGGFGQLCAGHKDAPAALKPDQPFNYDQYKGYLAPPNLRQELERDRGPADPLFTGDFDQGVSLTPDGPYISKIDEGDMRPYFFNANSAIPYFDRLNRDTDNGAPGVAGSGGTDMSAGYGPNKYVQSAIKFASLPTGASSNWPWQTLLCRPDPNGAPSLQPSNNGHYGGARRDNSTLAPLRRFPRDHMLLDFFWMPVVEPYAISSTFSTKGKINMNYHIWPFRYIHRSTALHALLKSERIMAIPDLEAANYKARANMTNLQARYRYWIDAKRTLNQFERKFRSTGEFANDTSKVFKFPSEICELWLVPEAPEMDTRGVYNAGELNAANPGNYTDDSYKLMRDWWLGSSSSSGRTLTGDNTKEAPYNNLYPRLTTRSNVFKVYIWVQTIQKLASTPPDKFVSGKDEITSEYRGSAIVERTLDTTDPELQKNDFFVNAEAFTDPRKSLDYFYTYRVTEVKQFTP